MAVNASGELGKVSREGRHDSHACGALLKVQGDLQKQEALCNTPEEGWIPIIIRSRSPAILLTLFTDCLLCRNCTEHEEMDPEYTILKHRLEQHMVKTGIGHKGIELHTLTKVAEQAITDVSTLVHEPQHHRLLVAIVMHVLRSGLMLIGS